MEDASVCQLFILKVYLRQFRIPETPFWTNPQKKISPLMNRLSTTLTIG